MLDLDTFDTMIDWKMWFPPNVRTRERERLLKNMEENDIENKDIMKNLLRKTF